MNFKEPFQSIIRKVMEGIGPTKEECKYLFTLEPHSLESTYMMSVANNLCRTRLNNCGIIYAQIGIDIAPCRANCEFCSFAQKYADIQPHRMSMEEIQHAVATLGKEGDLMGVFLMTIERNDQDYIIEAVKTTRASLPAHTQVWVNIGDMSYENAVRLKEAGVNGAYHVLRLREGEDTNLSPRKRRQTFENIEKAGLQLFTCCEPIGPEHTADEIFDRVFMNYEYSIIQQSAMRRTYIPSLPISKRGVISQLRLAQITAIITLSSVSYPHVAAVASHEPNLLTLTAGSNITSAEWGTNPREDTAENSRRYGLTINECRRLLFEAGYTSILTSNFNRIPLNEEYLIRAGAL